MPALLGRGRLASCSRQGDVYNLAFAGQEVRDAGEIGFRSGDREVVLGPGGYITKPRGEAHAMWNAGADPARMIEVISPAGFELFFRAVVDLLEAGDVHPEHGARLAAQHGLSFVDTPWLADVVRRFDLKA